MNQVTRDLSSAHVTRGKLTSEPRDQAATIELQVSSSFSAFMHDRPNSRDMISSSGVEPWHSYRMMCFMNGRFERDSITGSYWGRERERERGNKRSASSSFSAPVRGRGRPRDGLDAKIFRLRFEWGRSRVFRGSALKRSETRKAGRKSEQWEIKIVFNCFEIRENRLN